jgi:peptidoglycan/LPS O-acetylase OafA/YrhL
VWAIRNEVVRGDLLSVRSLDLGESDKAGMAPVLPKVLPRLTSLRALAALFVFGYHLEAYDIVLNGRAPLTVGYTGVSFFFILSGFVLTWSFPKNGTARDFYYRRFARIYPVYLIMLVVAYAAPYSAAPPHRGLYPSLLAVFLLQSWFPRFAYSVNSPAWSLSCEAFYYAIFPFIVLVIARGYRRMFYILGSSWVLGTAIVGILLSEGVIAGSGTVNTVTNPVLRSGEFVLGVLCAAYIKDGKKISPWLLFTVICGSMALVASTTTPAPIPEIELELFCASLILWCASVDIHGKSGLLTGKVFVYAGSASYAFYLTHLLMLVTVQHYLGNGWPTAIFAFGAAATSAVVLHQFAELPAQRFFLRKRRTYSAK